MCSFIQASFSQGNFGLKVSLSQILKNLGRNLCKHNCQTHRLGCGNKLNSSGQGILKEVFWIGGRFIYLTLLIYSNYPQHLVKAG